MFKIIEPTMTTIPMIWRMNNDDGFFYAEGAIGQYRICPIYLHLGKTSFQIEKRDVPDEDWMGIGMCLHMISAKTICDLLENG